MKDPHSLFEAWLLIVTTLGTFEYHLEYFFFYFFFYKA